MWSIVSSINWRLKPFWCVPIFTAKVIWYWRLVAIWVKRVLCLRTRYWWVWIKHGWMWPTVHQHSWKFSVQLLSRLSSERGWFYLWWWDSWQCSYYYILDLLTNVYSYRFAFLDIDECLSDPCHSNATCNNTIGSFTCTCVSGYSGDGFQCIGEWLQLDSLGVKHVIQDHWHMYVTELAGIYVIDQSYLPRLLPLSLNEVLPILWHH